MASDEIGRRVYSTSWASLPDAVEARHPRRVRGQRPWPVGVQAAAELGGVARGDRSARHGAASSSCRYRSTRLRQAASSLGRTTIAPSAGQRRDPVEVAAEHLDRDGRRRWQPVRRRADILVARRATAARRSAERGEAARAAGQFGIEVATDPASVIDGRDHAVDARRPAPTTAAPSNGERVGQQLLLERVQPPSRDVRSAALRPRSPSSRRPSAAVRTACTSGPPAVPGRGRGDDHRPRDRVERRGHRGEQLVRLQRWTSATRRAGPVGHGDARARADDRRPQHDCSTWARRAADDGRSLARRGGPLDDASSAA